MLAPSWLWTNTLARLGIIILLLFDMFFNELSLLVLICESGQKFCLACLNFMISSIYSWILYFLELLMSLNLLLSALSVLIACSGFGVLWRVLCFIVFHDSIEIHRCSIFLLEQDTNLPISRRWSLINIHFWKVLFNWQCHAAIAHVIINLCLSTQTNILKVSISMTWVRRSFICHLLFTLSSIARGYHQFIPRWVNVEHLVIEGL